jgi:methylmalonyl-CoA/ethylmalonyl-CoA epimerase
MDLHYSHVDVLVADLEAATDYYRDMLDFEPGTRQTWKRDEFHVEFVVMSNPHQKFVLVQPIAGPLLELLKQKGEGTVYRLCFAADDIDECYHELVERGIIPEDENGRPLAAGQLESPTGRRILWLPKVFGDLSVEILEPRP